MASMAGEVSGAVSADRQATNNKANRAPKSAVQIPQKPQLIRTADLSLRRESIDKMMVQLRRMVQSKQGDIYDFQDERPQGNGQRRQASLVLKVPCVAIRTSRPLLRYPRFLGEVGGIAVMALVTDIND
ncbi:DUF4349 domain-containing protein [Chamaesiphon sp. VAR_48_metabat_135_sub]|uniref:DUF4349 domain-containing protein n=1 Tax=Chamaesiphon sp. VAR_48_metabat_135_sub TaxID=2964699 RepID=UPI00286A1F08|nr:DUF4349 domain-containing protein [Chamaesiphon sp. VAR_48_metabat_135_sub]